MTRLTSLTATSWRAAQRPPPSSTVVRALCREPSKMTELKLQLKVSKGVRINLGRLKVIRVRVRIRSRIINPAACSQVLLNSHLNRVASPMKSVSALRTPNSAALITSA